MVQPQVLSLIDDASFANGWDVLCRAVQVDNMTNKHAVFMTRDGRISLAGLSSSKVDYLADAMVDSIRNH